MKMLNRTGLLGCLQPDLVPLITASWTWQFSSSSPPCPLNLPVFHQIPCEHVMGESGETVLTLPDGFLVLFVPRNDSQDYFFNYLHRDGGWPDCDSSGFPFSPFYSSCPSLGTGINTSWLLIIAAPFVSLFKAVCLVWCFFFLCCIFGVFLPGWHSDGFFLISVWDQIFPPSMGTLQLMQGAEEKVGVGQSRISS